MKKTMIFVCLMLGSLYCFASHINQISNITFDRTIAHSDNHRGAICQYEDRLYVENRSSIDEYQILPDHQLILIGFFEKITPRASGIYIKDGKLYAFDAKRAIPQIYIFNISISPMVLEATIESPMAPNTDNTNICSYNDYLLFSEEGLGLVKRFNTVTRTFEADIQGMDILFTVKDSILIKINQYTNQNQVTYKLGFYNLNDCNTNAFGQLITEFEFADENDCERFYRIKTQGDTLFVMGYGYFKAINISDLNNPTTMFFRSEYTPGNTIHRTYTEMLIKNNYFYLFRNDGKFLVFDLNDPTLSTVVYDTTIDTSISKNSCHIVYPCLFLNAGTNLAVYQIDNGIELIDSYGLGAGDVLLSNEFCGVYDRKSSVFLFYNLLDENPTPQYLFKENEAIGFSFIIKDQKLFLISECDGQKTLEYYNTSVYPYQLISSHTTNGYNLNKIDNKLFVNAGEGVDIYQVHNDTLEYLMNLSGNLQKGYQNDDFFVISHMNQLEFRYLSNPSVMITSYAIPNMSQTQSANIDIINENYMLIKGISGQPGIYFYDLNGNINKTCNVPNYALYLKNEIMSIVTQNNETITFKYVGEGILNPIGNYCEFKMGQWYFYPEQHKIINKYQSSLNLYHFDYTVATDEQVSPVSKFVTVYPNPNQGDVFQFKLSKKTENAELSVFNIKGQLVYKTNTVHTDKIVWDSKNDKEMPLSSGIYFYKIKTGSKSGFGKFLKIK